MVALAYAAHSGRDCRPRARLAGGGRPRESPLVLYQRWAAERAAWQPRSHPKCQKLTPLSGPSILELSIAYPARTTDRTLSLSSAIKRASPSSERGWNDSHQGQGLRIDIGTKLRTSCCTCSRANSFSSKTRSLLCPPAKRPLGQLAGRWPTAWRIAPRQMPST